MASDKKGGRAKGQFKRDQAREKHTISMTGKLWRDSATHARALEGVRYSSELFSRVVEILNGERGLERDMEALTRALGSPTRREVMAASVAEAMARSQR